MWRRAHNVFRGRSQAAKVAIAGGFFTLVSTVLAGVFAVIAAFVPVVWSDDRDDGHPGSSAAAPPAVSTAHPEQSSHVPSASTSSRAPRVSITSWTESPATSSAKTYVFSGTVTDLPDLAEIHVVVQLPGTPSAARTRQAKGAKWLVSPQAEIVTDREWQVTWTVAQPPPSGRWVAVIIGWPGGDQGLPTDGNPRGGEPSCPPGPPGCTPAQHLAWDGPDAEGVYATATAAPAANRRRPVR